MTPPPLPALVIASGLALNLARSRRNRGRVARGVPLRPTVSRWACEHKALTLAGLAVGNAWLVPHVARYVIELPNP
jgi:hypothetical protein